MQLNRCSNIFVTDPFPNSGPQAASSEVPVSAHMRFGFTSTVEETERLITTLWHEAQSPAGLLTRAPHLWLQEVLKSMSLKAGGQKISKSCRHLEFLSSRCLEWNSLVCAGKEHLCGKGDRRPCCLQQSQHKHSTQSLFGAKPRSAALHCTPTSCFSISQIQRQKAE